MTAVLLKSVTIIDRHSPYHGKETSIFLENGKIKKIGAGSRSAERTVHAEGLKVSIGWLDLRAFTADPGYEYKEDIDSFCRAAAAGGFTGVVCLPNTQPAVRSKDAVLYLKNRSSVHPVTLYPTALLSTEEQGEQFTEMIDLHKAGAVAFTDGLRPTMRNDVMLRAMQYAKSFDGLIISRPKDILLAGNGQMHEGAVSTLLGLRGIPSLAEEMVILRDLELVKYTGCRVHFAALSCARAVRLIGEAKKQGLPVSCDAAAHHLFFTDESLSDFNTDFKTDPPLRTDQDRKALLKGLASGVIDAVVSDHQPQDEEHKKTEFDAAAFGIIGLQTAFSAALTACAPYMSLEAILEKFTEGPRTILNLPSVRIAEGEACNMTLFSDTEEYTFTPERIVSKSHNSPFIGQKLRGVVYGVFNLGKYYLNSDLKTT